MDQLLVALDVDSAAQAEGLTRQLEDLAGGFKVGSRLFTANGPQIVRQLTVRGIRVFLDLKFHDIPNQVAQSVAEAAQLGVWMLTLHTSGGMAMMRASIEAAADAAARIGMPRPLIVGVTVLTSFDRMTLGDVGIADDIPVQVERLAALAHRSGIDGVVASPLEVAGLRRRYGADFLIVTPGIRDADGAKADDDQRRTLNAAEALKAGASYLVVGRPIIRASDPRAAAERLIRAAGFSMGK